MIYFKSNADEPFLHFRWSIICIFIYFCSVLKKTCVSEKHHCVASFPHCHLSLRRLEDGHTAIRSQLAVKKDATKQNHKRLLATFSPEERLHKSVCIRRDLHHRIEGGWLRESETGQSPLERREYSDILSMGLQALEAASWNGCKETVHVFASCLTSIVTNNVVVNLLKPRGQYWKQAPPYWPPDSECWTY